MGNLGNLKLVCQLPIAPWNLFDLKIRTFRCGRAPNQKGKIIINLIVSENKVLHVTGLLVHAATRPM